MKAVVKTEVGYDHMEYMDIPEPEATGDLVKIKIAYSGICGTDLHAFKGSYGSTKPPVVLGHEFSGIVVDVGPDVKNVKVGDRVRILSGPFANVEGVVESMNDETEIATVLTIMFSQETPTDVSYIDLEKLD